MPNSERPTDDSLPDSNWQEIYSICDRFEAAWDSEPSPPKLKDYLVANWSATQQRILFRDLLIVELDRRLANGERPQKQEYLRHFATFAESIDQAFAAQETPELHKQTSRDASNQEPERAADWHLVFGLLALQNGLISREQLIVAFAQWTSDKTKPLDQILVEQRAIDRNTVDILRQLVQVLVRQHGNDLHRTLMTLSGSDLPAAKKALAKLNDTDLQQSIATLRQVDSAKAAPPRIGEATSTSGRFRILRPLPGAKGGMGEISIARDEELGRQVALKQILSDKADHAAYRQKFQVEAEITGNLEHPGIVPIYGLGIGKDGRPYYAMRLVHGDNLSEQIKQLHDRLASGEVDYNSVDFRGLVDRLIDVAQAIRYAHSRGVLHRDLKPGNILVGKYGETLVIDWGLARLPQADQQESPSESPFDSMPPLDIRSGSNVDATMQGQILGTVGYAPPEQLNGRVDLITERSDVYALGAILYQILLGDAPISTKGKRPLDEVIRATIEGKIVSPRRERRAVPKALSAVCMKALDREPDNRYATVEEFISELENWKADQPVAAAPDSLADRLMRLARRYRAAALASAAALIGILIVAAVALIYVNRARVDEAAARGKAETLAKRNQTVVDSFVAAFRSPDPENEGVTSKMSAREVLEQALAQIEADEDLAKDELTKATLLDAIGYSLYSLGAYDRSVSAQEDSLRLRKARQGDDHPDTLNSMNELALGYDAVGRREEAMLLYEETTRLRKTRLGDGHPDTLTSMNNLAVAYKTAGRQDEAIRLYKETLELRKATLGLDHPDTLNSMNNLAVAYNTSGRHGEAVTLHKETLELRKATLGPDHPHTLNSISNLAEAYRSAGSQDLALSTHRDALARRKAKLGSDHPDTFESLNNLARAYYSAGRYDHAISFVEQAFEARKAKLGPDHPDTLESMNDLGVAYVSADRAEEALPLHREALERRKAKLGSDHPHTLNSMNSLAYTYLLVGRLNDAMTLFQQTFELRKAKLGSDHPDTLNSMTNLARTYQSAGRLTDALPLYEKALRLMKTRLRPDHPYTLSTMNNLATAYRSLGRLDEALTLYEETFELSKAKWGPDHLGTLPVIHGLQVTLLRALKFKRAKEVIEEWIGIIKPSATPDQPQLARAQTSLAEALLGMEDFSEASEQARLAIDIKEIDNLQRARAKSIQGAIFASEDDWEKAEPLLVESGEALTTQLAEMESYFQWYVPRAHERVIAMYEAWGSAEEVAKWKLKLADVNAEIERLRNQNMQPNTQGSAATETE